MYHDSFILTGQAYGYNTSVVVYWTKLRCSLETIWATYIFYLVDRNVAAIIVSDCCSTY